jgi:hypothetical protein
MFAGQDAFEATEVDAALSWLTATDLIRVSRDIPEEPEFETLYHITPKGFHLEWHIADRLVYLQNVVDDTLLPESFQIELLTPPTSWSVAGEYYRQRQEYFTKRSDQMERFLMYLEDRYHREKEAHPGVKVGWPEYFPTLRENVTEEIRRVSRAMGLHYGS